MKMLILALPLLLISQSSPAGTDNVPRLMDKLESKDAKVRWEAIQALAKAGPEAKAAIPKLIRLLRNEEDWADRQNAAWGLWKIGGSDRAVVDALIEALQKDKHEEVRSYAATCLSYIGTEAKTALPTLIEVLKNKNEKDSVRVSVAGALGSFGPHAKAAIAPLTHAVNSDKITLVRSNAANSIRLIGPDAAALKILDNALSDEEAIVRASAALALLQNGSKSKVPFVTLLKALKDKKDIAFTFASRALLDIGPNSKNMVPALIDALADENVHVRRSAAYSLQRIGPAASSAIPALKKALADENESVRDDAGKALQAINRKPEHSK